MARILTIYCKVCGERATIRKHERQHDDLSVLYCKCNNIDCGHHFVSNLQFSHTTRSSKLTQNGLIAHLISRLSAQDKQEIIKTLSK